MKDLRKKRRKIIDIMASVASIVAKIAVINIGVNAKATNNALAGTIIRQTSRGAAGSINSR